MGALFTHEHELPSMYQILDSENPGKSLIRNLGIDLSKHLRKMKEGGERVILFIETRWLPQRESTKENLEKLVQLHKEKNIVLDKVQVTSKSISAGAKIGAVGAILVPPVAIGALAVSLGADAISAGTSIARNYNIKESVQIAESVLLMDRERSEQLQELVSGYHLLLKEVNDSVAKLHKATLDGLFDTIQTSPALAKFFHKVRSTTVLNHQSIKEILEEFVNAVTDVETYQDIYMGICDLMSMNPKIADGLKDAVEVWGTAFSMGILMNTTVNAFGKYACIGLNILFIVKDFHDIAMLVSSLEGEDSGTDEIVIELEGVIRALNNEMRYINRSVNTYTGRKVISGNSQ